MHETASQWVFKHVPVHVRGSEPSFVCWTSTELVWRHPESRPGLQPPHPLSLWASNTVRWWTTSADKDQTCPSLSIHGPLGAHRKWSVLRGRRCSTSSRISQWSKHVVVQQVRWGGGIQFEPLLGRVSMTLDLWTPAALKTIKYTSTTWSVLIFCLTSL